MAQVEANRLWRKLVGFPTGEQQDRELLEGGSLENWRERVIVRFRMLRKQALRLTMEGISAALSHHSSSPSVSDAFAGARRPVVVVPVREDPGLEEPKILQIGTPEVEEL